MTCFWKADLLWGKIDDIIYPFFTEKKNYHHRFTLSTILRHYNYMLGMQLRGENKKKVLLYD